MHWVRIDSYDAGRSIRAYIVDVSITSGPRPKQGGWALCDEVHEWLEPRVDRYHLTWSTHEFGHWHIGIEDAEVATLFKLTFG